MSGMEAELMSAKMYSKIKRTNLQDMRAASMLLN